MMGKLGSICIAIIAVLFVGCGQKQVVLNKTTTNHKEMPTVIKPKHKLVVPYSKDIYSTHKYARFMYQDSCYDLEFRRDDLLRHEMKYDPLAVIEILKDIDRDIKRNGCK